MPKIDLAALPRRTGTIYPPPHDAEVAGRSSLRAGDAGGLTQFGANIVILPPGANASMRHWHEAEDEFLVVLEGELILVDDDGEHPMLPGECAAFPAGQPNGHRMINRGTDEGRFLVVGTKARAEVVHYPDHGLKLTQEGGRNTMTQEDGTPLRDSLRSAKQTGGQP